jgi:hypothetical protein
MEQKAGSRDTRAGSTEWRGESRASNEAPLYPPLPPPHLVHDLLIRPLEKVERRESERRAAHIL